jgi:hypothetical protein
MRSDLATLLPRTLAVALVAAAGAGTVHAQSGLRLPGAGPEARALEAARAEAGADAEVQIALTPVGGQGFTFVPRGWAGTPGLRLPQAAAAASPARFALAPDAGSGAALDVKVQRWTMSSSVQQGLIAAQPLASRVDFGASYGLPLAQRHELVVSGGLGFGAGTGLAPTAGQQGTASEPLLLYGGGTGLRDAGLRLSWRYSLDRNLFVNTSVGVDRMFADPTGLGASYERNVGSIGAVFGYRFY